MFTTRDFEKCVEKAFLDGDETSIKRLEFMYLFGIGKERIFSLGANSTLLMLMKFGWTNEKSSEF